MEIQVNGKIKQLPKEVETVADLLHYFGLDAKMVIVEQNKEIVSKDNFQGANLQSNDTIELVRFVGGG
ncbi:sulfur carrier protein ThiS [Thalassobacillus pellis]|uniref:sulfur carrier protein ThiS n=1 Tax=Thalassobacillus pellis TaxID=748008 RepID=UPI0019610E2F|nr:sulfur carrier protein [Thalassobacillus pellis]